MAALQLFEPENRAHRIKLAVAYANANRSGKAIAITGVSIAPFVPAVTSINRRMHGQNAPYAGPTHSARRFHRLPSRPTRPVARLRDGARRVLIADNRQFADQWNKKRN